MLIDPDKIILTRPERGLNLRKIASMVNVLFFWGVTVYIMRSLFQVFGWLIMYFIFGSVLGDTDFEGVIRSVYTFYLPLVLLASLVLYSWAGYNRYRYGGDRDKRRVHPPALSNEAVSEYTRLTMAKVDDMQDAKMVVCHFDSRRELKGAECFDQVAPLAQSVDSTDPDDCIAVSCDMITWRDGAVKPAGRTGRTRRLAKDAVESAV